MNTTYHIYPVDMYRANALQAFLTRGYEIDVAVKLAQEAAEKMQAEVASHAEYDFG